METQQNNKTTALSYMERFQEMERALGGVQQVAVATSDAFFELKAQIENVDATLIGLSRTIDAMLGLLSDGTKVSKDSLLSRVFENKNKEEVAIVDKMLKNNVFVETEVAAEAAGYALLKSQGLLTLVKISDLQDETVKSTIIGSKKGDSLKDSSGNSYSIEQTFIPAT